MEEDEKEVRQMKKHITRMKVFRKKEGENSTRNEMNVRGKIVNVLVQVNRKSIVKTLGMGRSAN